MDGLGLDEGEVLVAARVLRAAGRVHPGWEQQRRDELRGARLLHRAQVVGRERRRQEELAQVVRVRQGHDVQAARQQDGALGVLLRRLRQHGDEARLAALGQRAEANFALA